jgi:hypothetical protein
MAFVTCPSCGEKGKIPLHLVGKRIKCQKCATSFQVSPPVAKTAAVPATATAAVITDRPRPGTIEVEGLEASTWAGTAVVAEHAHEHEHEHEHEHDEATAAFTASPHEAHHEPHHAEAAAKQYKVLTQKDKWFDGKFELPRLEEALNHYARHGWVVRSMTTAQVAGFSGGPREEIVVLLEK